MNQIVSIDLKTLVGEHELSGCDCTTEQILEWGEEYVSAGVIRFVLNGKTYAAVEDPNDGYRSSLRYLHRSDKEVENRFPPVQVVGVHVDRDWRGYGGESDIIKFINTENGKTVLEVGTDNIDDYYPGCVMQFYKENITPPC